MKSVTYYNKVATILITGMLMCILGCASSSDCRGVSMKNISKSLNYENEILSASLPFLNSSEGYEIRKVSCERTIEDPPSPVFWEFKDIKSGKDLACLDGEKFLESLAYWTIERKCNNLIFILSKNGIQNWPEFYKKDVVAVMPE